ncbi:MAG: P-loop NTPase, partial [Anaerolineae bacterium]
MIKVFLSSTSKDLKDYREAVFRAISALEGYHVVRMENFTAADWNVDEFCRREVARCDLFLGLIGLHYGESPPGSDRSYTMREYDAAVSLRRPRLIFLAPEDFPAPGDLRESDELWNRQQLFREKVKADRLTSARWDNQYSLAADVVAALHNWEIERPVLQSFYPLDEFFRRQALREKPADFYNGTRPNWANIALKHDARRLLYDRVRQFVEDDSLPPQRAAIITGLAGEGKTTLLMRLAWDLAEAGYHVLWRTGSEPIDPEATGRYLASREEPAILCFNRADAEEGLPALAAYLTEKGSLFTFLMEARLHEWRAAGMQAELRRSLSLQPFHIVELEREEIEAILDKLEAAGELGALEGLPRQSQIAHFADKLKADRQLLPALLTAKAGQESFEAIVEDVLRRVLKWEDGKFLVHAHALLSAVHRFGLWLSRPLYALALNIQEREVGRRILSRLEGELLAVSEVEGERLYTRHPVIAQKVYEIAIREGFTVEPQYLYGDLVEALGRLLEKDHRLPERKLLTILPLGLKKEGEYEAARLLFERGTKADPTSAPTWQA